MTLPSTTVWQIPDPLSTHKVQVDDDTVIVLRQHGNPEGPRLLLSHGNGLASDLYYPFWSLLADDFDLVVYDLRNHGWNEVGALENHSVQAFAQDHDRIAEAADSLYGRKPTVGVFHSISALAGLHLPSRGTNYSALVLFTAPLCNRGHSYGEFRAAMQAYGRHAKEPYDMVPDQWMELSDLHAYLPYFQRAVPGVLELVARTTLREAETGQGYELRCPREYEAQIWDDASVPAVSVDFGSLRCPTKIIGSDPALDPGRPRFDFADADAAGVDHELLPRYIALPTAREAGGVRGDDAEIPGTAGHRRVPARSKRVRDIGLLPVLGPVDALADGVIQR